MKSRLLRGWTFKRFVYLAVGIVTIISAFQYDVKLIAFAGAYFAAMGLFSFGCADGNCYTGYRNRDIHYNDNTFPAKDVEFEKVK